MVSAHHPAAHRRGGAHSRGVGLGLLLVASPSSSAHLGRHGNSFKSRTRGAVPKANWDELRAAGAALGASASGMPGVDWELVQREIGALPSNPALPTGGPSIVKAGWPWCLAGLGPEATVHGDAHLGNIMWHRGQLKLIDFDMTAVGPAGMDLAYLVLMLHPGHQAM